MHRKFVYDDFPECCSELNCFLSKNTRKTQMQKKTSQRKINISLNDPLSFSRKDLLGIMSGIVKDFNWKLWLESKPKESELEIGQNFFDIDNDFKTNLRVEDDHHKPLFCMGHVQVLRKYSVLKSVNLTDREFQIYTEVKFGNGFTTSIKKFDHLPQQNFPTPTLDDKFESQEVESVFIFDNLEEVRSFS